MSESESESERTRRPVWLLDVDGVLNAVSRLSEAMLAAWPGPCWRFERVNGFEIAWSTGVVDFINEVSRQGLAEVLWHTTWGVDAAKLIAPALGLDAFEVADLVSRTKVRPRGWDGWWKLQAGLDVVDSGRRLIWTDDDLFWERRTVEIQLLADRTKDVLLVHPDTAVGLTPEHLKVILGFINPEWKLDS